jgi:response regulator RpfG family c-di-GMP phosphodiesterase
MHTVLGARVLENVVHCDSGGFLEMAAAIARFHHERFDGTGYPEGLREQDIPLSARSVALADVFDALTSVRPYKPAYSANRTRHLIRQDSGTHFDPVIVEAFDACFDDFVAICERHRDRIPATALPSADVDGCGDPAGNMQLATSLG